MAKRTTIYIGKELAEILEANSERNSTSGTINTIADRYQEMVRRSMPVLSLGEWSLLFDVLNGYMPGPANMTPSILWSVKDAISGPEALADKWEIDGPELIANLEALPFASFVAILDASERWWGSGPHQDMDDSIKAVVGPQNVK